MAKLSVDAKLVRKLAALLRETGLTEIEYGSGSERIRVSRPAATAPEMSAPPAAEPAVAAAPEKAEAPPPGTLFAPMVGTVYIAADADSEPFVKPGDRVEKGQTVLIIEAMKVMNPIPAPADGTVTAILVEDKQPVEFGEPLMVVG
jgi:acetyl-CoA carboxylase biotin carboxyl carrier protein